MRTVWSKRGTTTKLNNRFGSKLADRNATHFASVTTRSFAEQLLNNRLQMGCFGANEAFVTLRKQTTIGPCEQVRGELQTACYVCIVAFVMVPQTVVHRVGIAHPPIVVFLAILRQVLLHIPSLVNLAALHFHLGTENTFHTGARCFRSIHHHQIPPLQIQPSLHQIFQQPFDLKSVPPQSAIWLPKAASAFFKISGLSSDVTAEPPVASAVQKLAARKVSRSAGA